MWLGNFNFFQSLSHTKICYLPVLMYLQLQSPTYKFRICNFRLPHTLVCGVNRNTSAKGGVGVREWGGSGGWSGGERMGREWMVDWE